MTHELRSKTPSTNQMWCCCVRGGAPNRPGTIAFLASRMKPIYLKLRLPGPLILRYFWVTVVKR
jgi:hypothetical protein